MGNVVLWCVSNIQHFMLLLLKHHLCSFACMNFTNFMLLCYFSHNIIYCNGLQGNMSETFGNKVTFYPGSQLSSISSISSRGASFLRKTTHLLGCLLIFLRWSNASNPGSCSIYLRIAPALNGSVP